MAMMLEKGSASAIEQRIRRMGMSAVPMQDAESGRNWDDPG